MNDRDRTYLLKELTRTIDESDSTAAFCLCQRWILKNALALLKEDCHNCKLECLLQKYDELKEKYDALLKEQKEQIKNRDESLEKAREEIKWLRGMLKEQEAVVRCIYCKRRGTYDCPVYVGGDGMNSEPDDWYCADGERRTDDA